MPRGRGGRRQGEPGKAYPQRTDLMRNRQPVQAAPSKEYGTRVAQERAQQAIPLPAVAPVPLGAPTQRPDEPLMAGAPAGQGPGPEALMAAAGVDPDMELAAQLRGLYQAFPNKDIARLIASLDA